jgi:hypothetical protein
MKYNKELIDSIYNKRIEINYNEMYVGPEIKGSRVKIELKGKIKCPLLNTSVSSTVCVKFMDKEDWPRGIDQTFCSKVGCFINKSISRYQNPK